MPSRDIFTFLFYALINNHMKTAETAIPSNPRLPFRSSSLPQADLDTRTGISLSSPPFFCSDGLPWALPCHVLFGAKSQLSRTTALPKPIFSTPSKLPASLGHQNIIQQGNASLTKKPKSLQEIFDEIMLAAGDGPV
jgi:hypothetical protein